MKIAMIGWEYPPFKAGGLATHCYGLTRSLADKNINIDFYMPKTKQKVSSDKENLMPLCKECHSEYTREQKIERNKVFVEIGVEDGQVVTQFGKEDKKRYDIMG